MPHRLIKERMHYISNFRLGTIHQWKKRSAMDLEKPHHNYAPSQLRADNIAFALTEGLSLRNREKHTVDIPWGGAASLPYRNSAAWGVFPRELGNNSTLYEI